jgi:hypothetical protein
MITVENFIDIILSALAISLDVIHCTSRVNNIRRQNSYMITWWSAVFPGFGHFLLNQYLRGTFLTLSEVIVNSLGHINQAMVYSFCGQFQLAKSILEPSWIFGYILIFFLSIWDSFRTAVYQNKLSQLAELENEQHIRGPVLRA